MQRGEEGEHTQVLDKHTLDTSWRAGREGGEWDEEQGILPVFVALADSLQTQIPTPLPLVPTPAPLQHQEGEGPCRLHINMECC